MPVFNKVLCNEKRAERWPAFLKALSCIIVGSATNYTEASHKPSFLSDDELKHLILEVGNLSLVVRKRAFCIHG